MATNLVQEPGYQLSVVVSNPTAPDSGDPVRFGSLTGMAITDEGDGGNAATETTVNFGPFVGDFVVDDTSGAGIAVGAAVFYDDTGTGTGSVNLNDDSANGYFFGFALEAVAGNATTLINVYHSPSPGAGSLGAGTVGTSQLAAGSVTSAKLTATMATGFIPLPFTQWREVGTNEVQNLAAHGGILAVDSTPIFEFTNGDTDSALRLNWAATEVTAVFTQTPLPPDLDVTGDVVIHMRAAMEAANDTPVIDADSFFNEGDTKVSDASAAITGTGVAEYTITIAAADVPAGAQTLSVELTPAAHGTDKLYVYALWLEYVRI